MCTGPQWKQSGPDRDSPLGYLIASGILLASYRAVPVTAYLGVNARPLKGIGEQLEPFGEALRPFDQFGKHVRHLGSQGAILFFMHRPALNCALDAEQGSFRPIHGFFQGCIAHGSEGVAD